MKYGSEMWLDHSCHDSYKLFLKWSRAEILLIPYSNQIILKGWG